MAISQTESFNWKDEAMSEHSIGDPQPISMEAFDKDGIHVGSARFVPMSAVWEVTLPSRVLRPVAVDTAQEARELLRSKGAITFRESDGIS